MQSIPRKLVVAGIALIVAIGIWRGSRAAWDLGMLVTAGAFAGFILSRTTGLPGGFKGADWEPVGIASLVLEAAYCIVAARALRASPAPAGRRAPGRAVGARLTGAGHPVCRWRRPATTRAWTSSPSPAGWP